MAVATQTQRTTYRCHCHQEKKPAVSVAAGRGLATNTARATLVPNSPLHSVINSSQPEQNIQIPHVVALCTSNPPRWGSCGMRTWGILERCGSRSCCPVSQDVRAVQDHSTPSRTLRLAMRHFENLSNMAVARTTARCWIDQRVLSP